MKKTFLVLTILFWTFFVQSCGSKKKVTQREKIKTEVSINEVKEEKVIETFIEEKLESKKTVLDKLDENSTEEIEADSTGVVTVQVKQTDSGTVKIYTGVKKIKVSNEKTATKQTDTSATKQNIESSKESETRKETELKIKEEVNKRNTDVTIKRTPTWLWILLILVVLFILWMRNRKIRFFR